MEPAEAGTASGQRNRRRQPEQPVPGRPGLQRPVHRRQPLPQPGQPGAAPADARPPPHRRRHPVVLHRQDHRPATVRSRITAQRAASPCRSTLVAASRTTQPSADWTAAGSPAAASAVDRAVDPGGRQHALRAESSAPSRPRGSRVRHRVPPAGTRARSAAPRSSAPRPRAARAGPAARPARSSARSPRGCGPSRRAGPGRTAAAPRRPRAGPAVSRASSSS